MITGEKKIIKAEISGKAKKKKTIGNPIFDLLFKAFNKYGPHSDFIGGPSTTNLHFLSTLDRVDVKSIFSYFKCLKL